MKAGRGGVDVEEGVLGTDERAKGVEESVDERKTWCCIGGMYRGHKTNPQEISLHCLIVRETTSLNFSYISSSPAFLACFQGSYANVHLLYKI